MAVFVYRVTPKHKNYKFIFFTGEGENKELDDTCDLSLYLGLWKNALADKKNVSFEFCAVRTCDRFTGINLQTGLAQVSISWVKGKCVISVSYGHPDTNRQTVENICPKIRDVEALTDLIWGMYQDCVFRIENPDENSSDDDSSSE